ncbi:hypothetical protein K437DRAFT_192408 [Tilletiaria anomala UBC 951]|uniref:Uncharacterized protein n=1 Tax=Tilletiaria anomala (strain ATCC 24038 / CBS 436.72 / UBC 951) TaxID=1037660 RepID=A0A066VML4_TILAU|nr:uncharacterized protein K437DRAFT_192408 [Tilletiaria anomala UBC 951]KDN40004.1 hypothetical protein K437DRAFT_192408 [Tilletiaria anomala UBC 951]
MTATNAPSGDRAGRQAGQPGKAEVEHRQDPPQIGAALSRFSKKPKRARSRPTSHEVMENDPRSIIGEGMESRQQVHTHAAADQGLLRRSLEGMPRFGEGLGLGFLSTPESSQPKGPARTISAGPVVAPRRLMRSGKSPRAAAFAHTEAEDLHSLRRQILGKSILGRHWNVTSNFQPSQSSSTEKATPSASRSRAGSKSSDPCPPITSSANASPKASPAAGSNSPIFHSPALSSAASSPAIGSGITSPSGTPVVTGSSVFASPATQQESSSSHTATNPESSSSSFSGPNTGAFQAAQAQTDKAHEGNLTSVAVASAAGSAVILAVLVWFFVYRCRRRSHQKRLADVLHRFESVREIYRDPSRMSIASRPFGQASPFDNSIHGRRSLSMYGISHAELAPEKGREGEEVRVINYLAGLNATDATRDEAQGEADADAEEGGRVSTDLARTGIVSTTLAPSRDASFSWTHPTLMLPPAAARAMRQGHYVKRRSAVASETFAEGKALSALGSNSDGSTENSNSDQLSSGTSGYRSAAPSEASAQTDRTLASFNKSASIRTYTADHYDASDSAGTHPADTGTEDSWSSDDGNHLRPVHPRAPRLPPMLVPSITLTLDDDTLGMVQRPLSLLSSDSSCTSMDEELAEMTPDVSLSFPCSVSSMVPSPVAAKPAAVRDSWASRGSVYSVDTLPERFSKRVSHGDAIGVESVEKCLEMCDFPTLPPWSGYHERSGFLSQSR